MTASSGPKSFEITVSNFGPIARAEIDLRPMTVFVGPSNAGKSYMASLIYVLHSFFKGDLRSISYPHARRGPSFGFRKMPREESFLSESENNLIFEWFMEVIPGMLTEEALGGGALDDGTIELPLAIEELVSSVLDRFFDWNGNLESELARCYGVSSSQELVRHSSDGSAGFSLRSKTSSNQLERYGCDVSLTERGVDIGATMQSARPLSIGLNSTFRRLPLRWQMNPYLVRDDDRGGAALSLLLILSEEVASRVFDPVSRPAFFLPADRAGIMHAHRMYVRSVVADASRKSSGPDVTIPLISGVLGDFLEQLVAFDGAPQKDFGNHLVVAHNLERQLLKGNIHVGFSDIDYPIFTYTPSGWRKDLPLMNASSMVSELAPVVLYLRYVVQPGDLLIIEEPEAHLHPEMQALFTRQLVAAVQSGIRILITTHSEWILEELANLVRLSELPKERREGITDEDIALSPDQLGAWFFDPSAREGSVVKEIALDVESATFPAGFGLITESLYNRWVEISTRIQEG